MRPMDLHVYSPKLRPEEYVSVTSGLECLVSVVDNIKENNKVQNMF